MKVELDIDKAALIARVRQEYGIALEGLTFVPEGEVAHCYIAQDIHDERYFIKLLSPSRLGRISTSGLDVYLPLTWELHAQGILPHIAYPRRTLQGDFRSGFDGSVLVLYPFIEGRQVGFATPMPDAMLAQLAGLVGILHRSTSQVHVAGLRAEGFGLPFEGDLRRGLEALERVTTDDRPGRQALRELLWPRKGQVLGLLERLKGLQRSARRAGKPLVLCHTDLHGANLIEGEGRELYILDWEGVCLAPPEHDLFMFVGDDRFADGFLPYYEREAGPAALDPCVFGFYFYRRSLEDLTDWVVRILYENTDDAQDQSDLEGIVADCISAWPDLEPAMRETEAKLARLAARYEYVKGGT